ncbi:MAG: NAD(P)-dependent oxidoreductase [Anaerolineae bacterium]|nr:NAD(P)-dependent oxidoreductase [Anaerolineae bacterium]
MSDAYLITGGMGCIGAWVISHLLQQGKRVINFDISEDRHRLDALMTADEQAKITFVKGDLTQTEQVKVAFVDNDISHVIHLAALQVPFCRANPVLGAQVNVTGTINIFEAAKAAAVHHVVYASSIAVYGSADEYPPGLLAHDAPKMPHTLYGAYKVCNEQTAQIYFDDDNITSTALRPYTVFGVGRDQGLTSEPTKAMVAAVKGEDYNITFGGEMQFHYASDVALQFIEAADNPLDGAYAFNMGTTPVSVQAVADIIMKHKPNVSITVEENILPFPQGFDSTELHSHFDTIYETPLEEAIVDTLARLEKA